MCVLDAAGEILVEETGEVTCSENGVAVGPKTTSVCRMKITAAPVRSTTQRRASKWVSARADDAAISKVEANRFTDGLLRISAQIEGLPADLAKNHDHYLHGLPRK